MRKQQKQATLLILIFSFFAFFTFYVVDELKTEQLAGFTVAPAPAQPGAMVRSAMSRVLSQQQQQPPPPASKAPGENCASYAECRTSVCSAGKCVKADLHGSCIENTDCKNALDACRRLTNRKTGKFYGGKKCAPMREYGESCESDNYCASGRCVRNTCKRADNELCINDNECASDFCEITLDSPQKIEARCRPPRTTTHADYIWGKACLEHDNPIYRDCIFRQELELKLFCNPLKENVRNLGKKGQNRCLKSDGASCTSNYECAFGSCKNKCCNREKLHRNMACEVDRRGPVRTSRTARASKKQYGEACLVNSDCDTAQGLACEPPNAPPSERRCMWD